MAASVLVTDEMVAEETLPYFAGSTGHYDNTSYSHFGGTIGELACAVVG